MFIIKFVSFDKYVVKSEIWNFDENVIYSKDLLLVRCWCVTKEELGIKMLGNISNVGNLKSHVKEVKTTIEHIGLYLGLIFYTAIGAAVIVLLILRTNIKI